MIIGRSNIDAAQLRAKRLSKVTLSRKRNLDFIPQKDRRAGPVTSGTRSRFLSAGGATPSEAEFERRLGTNDLVDGFFLERAMLVAHPVCRISIGVPGGGERVCATESGAARGVRGLSRALLPRCERSLEPPSQARAAARRCARRDPPRESTPASAASG